MANTDERLKEIAEKTVRWDSPEGFWDTVTHDDVRFITQKAIEAWDALRRIRDVCNPETPFTRAVSKPVLKAMVELIDKVLED